MDGQKAMHMSPPCISTGVLKNGASFYPSLVKCICNIGNIKFCLQISTIFGIFLSCFTSMLLRLKELCTCIYFGDSENKICLHFFHQTTMMSHVYSARKKIRSKLSHNSLESVRSITCLTSSLDLYWPRRRYPFCAVLKIQYSTVQPGFLIRQQYCVATKNPVANSLQGSK